MTDQLTHSQLTQRALSIEKMFKTAACLEARSEVVVHTHGQNLMVQLFQTRTLDPTSEDDRILQLDIDLVKALLEDMGFYILDNSGLFHWNTFLAIFPENLEE